MKALTIIAATSLLWHPPLRSLRAAVAVAAEAEVLAVAQPAAVPAHHLAVLHPEPIPPQAREGRHRQTARPLVERQRRQRTARLKPHATRVQPGSMVEQRATITWHRLHETQQNKPSEMRAPRVRQSGKVSRSERRRVHSVFCHNPFGGFSDHQFVLQSKHRAAQVKLDAFQ